MTIVEIKVTDLLFLAHILRQIDVYSLFRPHSPWLSLFKGPERRPIGRITLAEGVVVYRPDDDRRAVEADVNSEAEFGVIIAELERA